MTRRRDNRTLALEDRFGSLDVWVTPTRLIAMRWPRAGRVLAWTLGEPVAATFVFGDVRVEVAR